MGSNLQTYSYDAEGRLAKVNNTAGVYTYDGGDRRVKKVDGASTTVYVYNAMGQMVAEYTNTSPSGNGGTSYLLADHLGSTRVVTDASGNVIARHDYLPFGGEIPSFLSARSSIPAYKAFDSTRQRFTSKERDAESGLDNFGARYDASSLGRFMTPDPGNASVHRINPQSWNAYAYVNNRPLALIDPNGLEPVKAQAGTIHGFAQNMNSTPHKVGLATGSAAASALRSLGETENFGPKNTAVFNLSANRYVYTARGGWVDMVHFVFYAGRAAEYKAQGNSHPVGSAVQDGYWQERADTFRAPWSAYSYEDLPSDLYGATFGAEFFDPTSSLTLAEQIEAFLSYLSPMAPTSAPNYAALPNTDSKKPPMARNHSTVPMYTLWSTPQPKACVEAHDSSGQGTGTHCER